MLNFDVLEKGFGIDFYHTFFKKILKNKKRSGTSLPVYLSGYILLTDYVSLSGCLYFARYWAVCLL